MYNQEKLGGKCCGCCCDYRRAVIIVNAVGIVLGLLGLVFYAVSMVVIDTFDDDLAALEQGFDEDLQRYTRVGWILILVDIIFSAVAIIGASQYNVIMVWTTVGWFMLHFLVTTIMSIQAASRFEDTYTSYEAPNPVGDVVLSALFTALYIYPHLRFIREVKSGILSHETYPREEFSCCCTPRRRF